MPEQDASDVGDFQPDDYRNSFMISERADLAALQTRGPSGIEQTILMNLESLQFLGGEIEILLGSQLSEMASICEGKRVVAK